MSCVQFFSQSLQGVAVALTLGFGGAVIELIVFVVIGSGVVERFSGHGNHKKGLKAKGLPTVELLFGDVAAKAGLPQELQEYGAGRPLMLLEA